MRLAELFAPADDDPAAQMRTKLLGGVVAFLGFQIVVGMLALTWFTLPIIMGTATGGPGFNGSPLDRWLVLLIYAVAMMLGLIILAAGAIQATTGQRGKPAIARLLFACATVAMLAGMGLSL